MRATTLTFVAVVCLADGRRQFSFRQRPRIEQERFRDIHPADPQSNFPQHPSKALATFLLLGGPRVCSPRVTPFVAASRDLPLSRNRRYLHRAQKPLMSTTDDSKDRTKSAVDILQEPIDGLWNKLTPRQQQLYSTLQRVGFPTVFAAVIGYFYFDEIALYIRSTLDLGTIRILQADDSQFMQNFITVVGLLFSILAGNAYSSLYEQQEAIYFALFAEVSEAKSLLEQTTLVCQGRPFYQSALASMRDYVKNDLRRLDLPSAQLLSSRPMEDPLESIMYMTSVGVPSIVYESVKNLRQARGYRLGAMQRKFPFLGIVLLYLLAFLELLAFPLLSAATADMDGVLNLQAFLFACLVGAVELVLRIIQELWETSGGVFNVDDVLRQMVQGLEEELEFRSKQAPPLEQFVNSATLKSSSGLYSGMVPMPVWVDSASEVNAAVKEAVGGDSDSAIGNSGRSEIASSERSRESTNDQQERKGANKERKTIRQRLRAFRRRKKGTD